MKDLSTFSSKPIVRERERPPWGAIAAAVMVLAGELAFCFRTEPLSGMPVFEPTADVATVVAKRTLFDRTDGAVVLLGDSSCMMGLDPAVIQKTTGRPVVNLGTLAFMTMAGFAAMADELLDRPNSPSMLVLAVLPRTFEVTEAQARREFDLLGRYLIAYDLTVTTYKPDVADYASLFFHKHRFNVFPKEFGGSYTALADRLQKTNGHLLETGTYAGTKVERSEFLPTTFACESMTVLIRSAERRKVPVMFWWSPTPVDSISSNYLKAATQRVLDLRNRSPWLQLPRAEAPGWDTEWFGSVTHLNPPGAQRNSAELAVVVQDELAR